MARGRPRKPVEAKILAGTYREDRDGPACATVAATGVPVKPRGMCVAASDLWDEVVPGLIAQAVIGDRDTAALTSMCEWWGSYRQNMDALVKQPVGSEEARAVQIAASEASRQFQALAARFGLTPSDRAKLRIEPTKKKGVATRQRA